MFDACLAHTLRVTGSANSASTRQSLQIKYSTTRASDAVTTKAGTCTPHPAATMVDLELCASLTVDYCHGRARHQRGTYLLEQLQGREANRWNRSRAQRQWFQRHLTATHHRVLSVCTFTHAPHLVTDEERAEVADNNHCPSNILPNGPN